MGTNAVEDLTRFQSLLARRLLAWALASLAAGALLVSLASGFWQGFGIQALAWGGVAVALLLGGRGAAWAGHGWGVTLQGAFLLIFDLIHAQSVPTPIEAPLNAFSGPEHLPFRLDAAPGSPGAVLVHGFPGTPAEMRPLAESLRREGWSVRVPLLPGFGPQIAGIAACRWQQWREAVRQALAEMSDGHHPLLLVGYSLGGALSAAAVEDTAGVARPDGLVLLAPFWRIGSPLQRQLRATRVPLSIVREIFAAGGNAFTRSAARRLRLPTLVIQGSEDTVVDPALTRRLLRRLGGLQPGGRPLYREVEAGHDLLDPRSPGWPDLAAELKEFAAGLIP